jgi:hypothetical protein
MASKKIIELAIAVEGSYGSIGVDGYPDGTGLGAFVAMEVADDAQLIPFGDAVQIERKDAKGGAWAIAPEPIMPSDSTAPLRRAKVTLSAWHRPLGVASAFASYAAMPLFQILRTRWGVSVSAPGNFDPVAAQINANSHTPTVVADYVIGQILQYSPGSLAQYTGITEATAVGPLVKYSPALSAALAAGQAVDPMTTLYLMPQSGVEPAGMSLLSLAVRLRGDGYEAIGYGVTLESMRLVGVSGENDARAWLYELTLDVPWVEYNPALTAPGPDVVADGRIVHSLGAPAVLSADVSTFTAPAGLAREYTPCVYEWSLAVAWQLEAPGCGSTWIGRGRPEAVAITADLEMFLADYNSDYREDWRFRKFRQIVLGGSAYDDQGEGGCLFLPAAVLAEEPIKPDVGTDLLRTRLHYRPGRYSGDNANTLIANSSIRLGWG